MTSTCAISFNHTATQAFNADRQAELAADQLGLLLFDTPEFQTYSRLQHAASQDVDVKDLKYQIRIQEHNYYGSEDEQPAVEDLYAQLEALPKMRELRQAERALRQLFLQVDAIISAAAQAPFAHYARSGCG